MAPGLLAQESLPGAMKQTGAPADAIEPVAVIGFSLKFPQDATSPEQFWRLMAEKRCATTDFPADRLNLDAFYHPKDFPVRGGHFLKEPLGAFDAKFFSLSPSEAAAMDPAQRMLLETAFRAFENAGIPIEALRGSKTSVHTGCFSSDYLMQFIKDPMQIPTHAATGASLSMLANRLSWFYDLTGPSLNIDSACSSSAIAVEQACQLLHDRESGVGTAVVAGCNLTFIPDFMKILSKMNMLSHDSRCFTFDERANGYARGEGIAVVILKSLTDAIRDNDTIRAVIRSVGSNQDGRTPGITQPNGGAQTRLMQETYRKAGLTMEETVYFEAHGTGTAIGDPTEVGAILDAFPADTSDPLHIGSVKTNIGHLEGASGLAGLIKTILILETGVILPNANFERPNRKIDVEGTRVSLPTTCIPWPKSLSCLRRASINSFGYGGANCHIVLDDAFSYLAERGLRGNVRTAIKIPQSDFESCWHSTPHLQMERLVGADADAGSLETPKLLVFSAAGEKSLERLISAYQEYCLRWPDTALDQTHFLHDLAYTLDSRRSLLPSRGYAVIESTSDIKNFEKTVSLYSNSDRPPPRLAFVFTGQGAQWYAMGRELIRYRVFEHTVEQANIILATIGCSWSVRDELLKSKQETRVNLPEFSQTLCVVLQIGLIELLRYFGVVPEAVVGHSSGEIAAAYCIGALSLEGAMKVCYHRGRLTASLPQRSSFKGGMISVNLSEEAAQSYIEGLECDLTVCCINSPENVTISGDESQIDILKKTMDDKGIFARQLAVSVAYHSPQMCHIETDYLNAIGTLKIHDPSNTVQMISSVTGALVTQKQLCQGSYWVQNMISPVLFLPAIQRLCLQSREALVKKLDRSHRNAVVVDQIIELGPHAALQRPVKDILKAYCEREMEYGYALYRGTGASTSILRLLSQLHASGADIDIRRVNDPNIISPGRVALADLPEYPFDHSQSYWCEGRMSSDHRQRKLGPVDLLGTPATDWNPGAPQWRHCVSLADDPWIEDHQVNGKMIYPGAAFLVMAIEAIRQLADPQRHVNGYYLRRVKFSASLEVRVDSADMETRTCLTPVENAKAHDGLHYQFAVSSLATGAWRENCTGEIWVEYRHPANQGDHSHSYDYRGTWKLATDSCIESVDLPSMYKFLNDRGLSYGPRLQGIQSSSYSTNDEAISSIKLSDANPQSPNDLHVVHPTSLDAIIQTFFFAQARGGSREMSTQVVSYLEKMWISNDGLASPADAVDVLTKLHLHSPRRNTAEILATNQSRQAALLVMQGLEMSAIGDIRSGSNSLDSAEQYWYNVDVNVDLDLLAPNEITTWLDSKCGPDVNGPAEVLGEIDQFLFIVIRQIKDQLEQDSFIPEQHHFRKYLKWADEQLKIHSTSQTQVSCPIRHEFLAHRLKQQGTVGNFFVEVASHALDVLRGSSDILQILFEDGLVKSYYQDHAKGSRFTDKMALYVDALAFKKPDMQILEVGAGTGSFTKHVLDALSFHSGEESVVPRYCNYTFTDVSPSFFDEAKRSFGNHLSRMSFGVLDLEKDPLTQGYQEGKYDMITASSVLHATKSLKSTLRTIRKLLKPGGKLIIHEPVAPEKIRTGFVFGLLPGWWPATEENHTLSPSLNEKAWDEILSQSGFTGADIVLPDYADESSHMASIIISTATEDLKEAFMMLKATIVINQCSCKHQTELANKIRSTLIETMELADKTRSKPHQSISIRITTIKDASALQSFDGLFIMLLEVGEPFLPTLDHESYAELKIITLAAERILWISTGASSTATPGFGMADGFARVLRNERANLQFTTVALQDSEAIDVQSRKIVQLAYQLSKEDMRNETEYVETDGRLGVSRLVESLRMDTLMDEKLSLRRSVSRRLGDAGPLRARFLVPGQIDTLEFVEDAGPSPSLEPDEVEVKVHAVGLHVSDLLVATGKHAGTGLGAECSGIVRRAGSACSIRPGDRVCAFGSSFLRPFAHTKERLVARIPDSMSYCQAAVLPRDYLMASSLLKAARVAQEDSILIHGGHTSLGKALITLACSKTTSIYVTTPTKEDCGTLSASIHSRDIKTLTYASFATQVRHCRLGMKFDLAIDLASGQYFDELVDSVSSFGRVLHMKSPNAPTAGYSFFQLPPNVMFQTIDTACVLQRDLQETDLTLASLMDATGSSKELYPKPQVFKLSELGLALTSLRDEGGSTRKAVSFEAGDEVTVIEDVRPTYRFDSKSTYLIAGGLGALGRLVARWMARRGAQNLILLSRYSVVTEEAQELLAEFAMSGVRVETPACDITNEEALMSALVQCSRTLPPIKGCIQASAVLKDVMYQNMSFQDWEAAVAPKVAGSWNLHRLLPEGLDFFVMASSVSGILGQITQINYAAANTYMDSLAKFRASLGEKAISLDLGLLATGGLLMQTANLSDRLVGTGHYTPMSEAEMLALFEYACDPNLPVLPPSKVRIVGGIRRPATIRAKGFDLHNSMYQAFWSHVQLEAEVKGKSVSDSQNEVSVELLLSKAESEPEASDIVATALQRRLARILALSEEAIMTQGPMHAHGIDSLSAVDLRNWIMKSFGVDVPVFDILGTSSIAATATFISKSWIDAHANGGEAKISNGNVA